MIKMPMFKNRFQFKLVNCKDNEYLKNISLQVVSVKDKNQCLEISLELDSRGDAIQDYIQFRKDKESYYAVIEVMDGGNDVLSRFVYLNLSILVDATAELEWDYASSGMFEQLLKLSYKTRHFAPAILASTDEISK